MLDKIDGLCAERARLKAELPKPKRKVLGGRKWGSTSKTIPTRPFVRGRGSCICQALGKLVHGSPEIINLPRGVNLGRHLVSLTLIKEIQSVFERGLAAREVEQGHA